MNSFDYLCVCSHCLNQPTEWHNKRRDMCVDCGENFLMVERLRISLAKYNPPNDAKFAEFKVNGETRTTCPNCGARANLWGKVIISLSCKFCDTSYHQFKSGIVYARNRFGENIPYLSNAHEPYFKDSIKVENIVDIDKEKIKDVDKLLNL